MKDGFLKVGVASVDVEVANPIHNKEKVMEVIKKADKNGVKLLVFPELVLTAYTCNDLFLQKTLLDDAKNQLFADFKAVKEGNVWCTGKNMFQETMGLGDMIRDMNAVFADDTEYSFTYLHQLK